MSDKDVATKMELDQSIAHALYDHGVFHEGVMPEKVRAIIREELAKSSCSRCKSLEDALHRVLRGDITYGEIADLLPALGKKESDK